MENNDFSGLPIYLTAKDLIKLEKCSRSAARERFKIIRKTLGLKRSEKLSWKRYCDHREITMSEAIDRYINLLIIAATVSIAAACCKIIVDYYSCKYFREHKMIYEERAPKHTKAYNFIYDPQTKKNEKVTTEIWIDQ